MAIKPGNLRRPAARRDDASPDPAQALLLDKYLPYQFAVLSGYIAQALRAGYGEPFNLTIPEWRLIAFLGNNAGTSAGEISERTRQDEVAIHRAVKSLLERGLVGRTIDPDDKRRKPLTLTEEGRKVFVAVTPLTLQLERELLKHVTKSEAAALRRIMDKLWKGVLGQAR